MPFPAALFTAWTRKVSPSRYRRLDLLLLLYYCFFVFFDFKLCAVNFGAELVRVVSESFDRWKAQCISNTTAELELSQKFAAMAELRGVREMRS